MTKDEAIGLFRRNKTAIMTTVQDAWTTLQDGDALVDRTINIEGVDLRIIIDFTRFPIICSLKVI